MTSLNSNIKRVVLKVGSSSLVDSHGVLDPERIYDLATQITELIRAKYEVVLVTSGAIAAAIKPLGLSSRPSDVPTLQACASVGQVSLINQYAQAFGVHHLNVGQVLLTRNETGSRTAYLHARDTIERLLELGVVPIVNENDTVAVEEIRFGDNDSLAAIVGVLVSADLVVILSDIEGLYTADPHKDPNAKLIEKVESIDDELIALAGGSASKVGTGGMITKLWAARALQMAGIDMIICQGRTPHIAVDAVKGTAKCTHFVANKAQKHESARKMWIGFAGHDAGSVIIDDGAREALYTKGGSLLPVGVVEVEGTFARGDIIAVRDTSGQLIARGITRYSSQEAMLTRGMKLDMVARVVPELAGEVVLHRDELVVF